MKNNFITLVGDIFPGNMDYNLGFGIASIFQNKGFVWHEQILEYFNKSEIVIGNLESPLIEDLNYSKMSFVGSPLFARELKECGINILNVANNHILEYDSSGFNKTLLNLKKYKINHIGSVKQKSKPLIIEKNNMRIGIAGFNEVHDIPNNQNYVEFNFDNAIETLNMFKNEGVDLIIFSLHFGWHNEYVNIPSPYYIQTARRLIDLGVNIIHGHHSHSIQPIEFYKNGIIFYSLGNFLFDMFWSKNVRTGLVANINISKNMFNVNCVKSQIKFPYKLKKSKNYYIPNEYKHISLKVFDKSKSLYSIIYFILLNMISFLERIKMKFFIVRKWRNIDIEVKRKIITKIKEKFYVAK